MDNEPQWRCSFVASQYLLTCGQRAPEERTNHYFVCLSSSSLDRLVFFFIYNVNSGQTWVRRGWSRLLCIATALHPLLIIPKDCVLLFLVRHYLGSLWITPCFFLFRWPKSMYTKLIFVFWLVWIKVWRRPVVLVGFFKCFLKDSLLFICIGTSLCVLKTVLKYFLTDNFLRIALVDSIY